MSERIDRVDALRGWALLGIAVVHFMEQYLGAMPPPNLMSYGQHGIVDRLLEAVGFVFIRGKGFALFSFLFGLSFALQMQHAAARRPNDDFRPRFAWRLVILGAIGVLHGLLYGGDILLIYAALGLPLIFFYSLRDRWLVITALFLLLGGPRVAFMALAPKPNETLVARSIEQSKVSTAQHWEILTHGSFADVVTANAGRLVSNKVDFQLGFMGRGYQTFGLFLLGLLAGRRRVFEDLEAHLALFRRVLRWSVGPTALIGALALAGMTYAALHPGGEGQNGPYSNPWRWGAVAAVTAYDAWNLAMTAFYISGFALVSRWATAGRLLLSLAPVGRLALSNYLAQTLVGSFVFMGYGLGLLGTVGNSLTLPMGLAFFALCAMVSRRWLTTFQYGPVEWLWRSLTLLKLQPFRKAPSAAAA